jgi:hypothetical protein
MERAREAGLDENDLRALFEEAVQWKSDDSASEAVP